MSIKFKKKFNLTRLNFFLVDIVSIAKNIKDGETMKKCANCLMYFHIQDLREHPMFEDVSICTTCLEELVNVLKEER